MTMNSILRTIILAMAFTFLLSIFSICSANTEPEPIFTIKYGELCNGTVNQKNIGEVTVKHTDGDNVCVKVVPDAENSDTNEVLLDCFSFSFKGTELAKAKYVSVKYKYTRPDGKLPDDKMTLRIMKNGNVLDASTYFTALEKPTLGEWTYAYFDLAEIYGKVKEDGTFKQIHLYPFGMNTSIKNLPEGTEMLISDISFYSEYPDINATFEISFVGGDPLAKGTAPKSFELKSGAEYTLPENPFTVDGSSFVGWKSSVDGSIHNAGEKLTCAEKDVKYTAVFKSIIETPDIRVLPLTNYQGGIVDKHDTAIVTIEEFEGVGCVKIAPNMTTSKPDYAITLDSFYSQTTDKIDIGQYSFAAIIYYVDAKLPKETDFMIRIMKNGEILTGSTYCPSSGKIVTDKWDFAVFDLSPIKEKLNPTLTEHLLKQIHITPVNDIAVKDFADGDAIYLGNLILFKEKPSIVTHNSYMKGYDGGLFKPTSNMTRAEACTIVARLLAGSDELVPTDKNTDFSDVTKDAWYHKYISYVESLGYLKSYSGSFEPNKAITRAEFVELVYNMGLLKDSGKNGVFTDVPQDHPKAAIIAEAGKAGLVNGYANDDGTFSFKPDNTITRAEVVKVINNAYSRSITVEALSSDVKYSFNDVSKDFWAYADIMEATLTHAENNGVWVSSLDNPLSLIGGKERANTAIGEEYIKTVDELSAKRISEIRSTPTTVTVTGQKYYISADGDDSKDGKTPETAWKTTEKLNTVKLSEGDGVFFRRGDIFRTETIKASSGVTYSAYGEGEKPKIYRSPENGADASKWTLLEGTTDIWVYCNKYPDVGHIYLDGKMAYKEIPDWYNNKYYVRGSEGTIPFDITKELCDNLDFFSKIDDPSNDNITTLYLCCKDGNPGEVFDSIEFGLKGNIFAVNVDNVTIDNLCLMHTGSHGIGGGTKNNLTVTNCEVGLIGGSLLRFYPDKFGQVVRYGNGIEIYGGCDGYTVDNCYVYECYDAGVTHQYDAGGTVNISMNNITYSNNVIERCVYSIEYFNGKGDDETVIRDGKNYKIIGNILRLCGYGWGQQRPNPGASTHITGGSSDEYEPGTYVIENNIFDRGLDSLLRTRAGHIAFGPIYNGNTYIQAIGMTLGETAGTKKLVFDYAADITIAEELGDKNAKVYWVSNNG